MLWLIVYRYVTAKLRKFTFTLLLIFVIYDTVCASKVCSNVLPTEFQFQFSGLAQKRSCKTKRKSLKCNTMYIESDYKFESGFKQISIQIQFCPYLVGMVEVIIDHTSYHELALWKDARLFCHTMWCYIVYGLLITVKINFVCDDW